MTFCSKLSIFKNEKEQPLPHLFPTQTADDRAMKIALEIAEKNPDAVSYAKQLFRESYSYGEGRNEKGGADQRLLDLETELQGKLLAGWNQKAKMAENFGVKLPYKDRKGE